jgi:hypothetical protein
MDKGRFIQERIFRVLIPEPTESLEHTRLVNDTVSALFIVVTLHSPVPGER